MTKVSSGKADSSNEASRDFIIIDDEKFEVGDCILVKGEASKSPFVAKIRSFKNKSKGVRHTKVNVFWFYRPEECKAGRRQFHGEKELFKSNHADMIDAETILQKCDVHSLSKYQDLEEEGGTDFYSRFTYDPAEDKFGPEVVPVYCVCEMPYNPDTYMIMCGRCEEWFHPRCLKLSQAKIKRYRTEQFYCTDCSKARGESSKKRKC